MLGALIAGAALVGAALLEREESDAGNVASGAGRGRRRGAREPRGGDHVDHGTRDGVKEPDGDEDDPDPGGDLAGDDRRTQPLRAGDRRGGEGLTGGDPQAEGGGPPEPPQGASGAPPSQAEPAQELETPPTVN